jgi:hypothetical protein
MRLVIAAALSAIALVSNAQLVGVPGARGAINPQTGQFYPNVGRGVINPESGQYYPYIGSRSRATSSVPYELLLPNPRQPRTAPRDELISGELRGDFVYKFVNDCRTRDPLLAAVAGEPLLSTWCGCVANTMADVTTVQVLTNLLQANDSSEYKWHLAASRTSCNEALPEFDDVRRLVNASRKSTTAARPARPMVRQTPRPEAVQPPELSAKSVMEIDRLREQSAQMLEEQNQDPGEGALTQDGHIVINVEMAKKDEQWLARYQERQAKMNALQAQIWDIQRSERERARQ